MRKRLIFASLTLFLTVGATLDRPRLNYDASVFALSDTTLAGAERSASVYRPCRGPEDDRCIQTNERAVRLALAEERPRSRPKLQVDFEGLGGPFEPVVRSRPNRPQPAEPIGL